MLSLQEVHIIINKLHNQFTINLLIIATMKP
jgi:hypothetical protein